MNPALLLLFVIVPLFAAGLTVVVRQAVLDRVLFLAVPLATALGGVLLLGVHARPEHQVLAHNVGSFVPGIAIPFVSDTLTALMLALTGVTTAVCGWFLCVTGEDRYRFVSPLILMLTTGVNGALLTGDLFNLFVFVEVMLLPSYALIAVTGTWRRLGIGRLFILVNLLTSTFLLVSVGWVYAAAGTVNLAALAGQGAADPRIGVALALVLFSLAIKGGAVPLHGWLPSAYPETSAGIMALFSALHTKVALYALYRIYAVGFGEAAAGWVGWALVAVVVATMLVGAVSTAAAARLRVAFAFQMVTGVGHILLGLVLFTGASLAAGLFYLGHHVVTVGGLLLLAGAIEQTYGSGRYDRLSGLMRRDRLVAVGMTLGLFSLVGLPPTSGLWGKVGLVLAAAQARPVLAAVLLAALVLAALASIMGLQRLWEQVFWGPPLEEYSPDDPQLGRGARTVLPAGERIPGRLAAPGLALIAVSVLMFLFGGQLYPIAQSAGEALLQPGAYAEAVLR